MFVSYEDTNDPINADMKNKLIEMNARVMQ